MAGNRPSGKALILLLAVFVLGGVIGGLGTYVAGHMRSTHRRQRIFDRLTQQVQLTPQEQKQVEAILAQGHQRFEAVYRQSQEQARPQYEAVRNDIRARIRALLTPEQQPKFDAFLKQIDAERKAREQQGPPRPPRPQSEEQPQSH
jgi:hypothetical protein